jgi:hypothetical protein
MVTINRDLPIKIEISTIETCNNKVKEVHNQLMISNLFSLKVLMMDLKPLSLKISINNSIITIIPITSKDFKIII